MLRNSSLPWSAAGTSWQANPKPTALARAAYGLLWLGITLLFLYERTYLVQKAGLPHFAACVVVRVGLLLTLCTLHLHLAAALLPPRRYGRYLLLTGLALAAYLALQAAYDNYLFGYVIGDQERAGVGPNLPHNLLVTGWYLLLTYLVARRLPDTAPPSAPAAAPLVQPAALPPSAAAPPAPAAAAVPSGTPPATGAASETVAAVGAAAASKCHPRPVAEAVPESAPAPAAPLVVVGEELVIRSEGEWRRVPVASVRYAQGLKDYTVLHTAQGRHLVKGSIGRVAEWLPAERFVRVHKSYLVAWQHVTAVASAEVRLGEQAVPIGRAYAGQLAAFKRGG